MSGSKYESKFESKLKTSGINLLTKTKLVYNQWIQTSEKTRRIRTESVNVPERENQGTMKLKNKGNRE